MMHALFEESPMLQIQQLDPDVAREAGVLLPHIDLKLRMS